MAKDQAETGLKPSPKAVRKGRKTIAKTAVALQRLAVEYVPHDSIHPNTYNPNRQSEHEFELLRRSMLEDGFTQPIIVHRATQTIVDGEHRWRVSKVLGYEDVPVVFVDMTPEQMKIATLRHNRARGTEDVELTAQVLRDLQALGAIDWAADSLMLDDTELTNLLSEASAADVLAAGEFGQAWVPGANTEGDQAGARTGMTSAALEQMREQERKLAAAKTEQERQAVKRDLDVYRISLVFANEEAKVVRDVLGDKPADALLQLCKAARR